jgi:hypothetical protein
VVENGREAGQYYQRRADKLLDDRLLRLEEAMEQLERRVAGMEWKLAGLIALGSILGPVLMERLLGGR